MKFLFRVPLFDFDPRSEIEVVANWEKILSAIAVSSPDLFQEIKGSAFKNLSNPYQKRLLKYMLRGRYRSTPFGLWAGVGIGRFEDHAKTVLDINRRILLRDKNYTEESDEAKSVWHLSLGVRERLGRIHFLSYVIQEGRWVFVSIPKNPLSTMLKGKLNRGSGLSFQGFKTWFGSASLPFLTDLWTQIKELGILSRDEKWLKSQLPAKEYVDVVLQDELTVPTKIKDELEDFFHTAGYLFTESQNVYLSSLANWFELKFDDRFVPLALLLEFPEFIFSNFLESQSHDETERNVSVLEHALYQLNDESVDLKELLPKKSLDDSIYDLAFVFKKLNAHEVTLENLVCNRPFSFFGRFNRDSRIYRYEQELKEKIYSSKSVLFAELRVFETGEVQGICDTIPLFEWYISPFPDIDKRALLLEDLEIGIREKKFVLYHRKHEKVIVPVVTHPLNGKEISHPLIRLLWELSQQDTFRLILHQSAYFTGRTFTPQVRWGSIILQPRKWKLNRDEFRSREYLCQWMEGNNIPEQIKIGIYDRELIIFWKRNNEFDILWSELTKNGRLTLTDPIWLESQEFTSKSGKYIYPEFVSNLSRPKKDQSWSGFINSITEEDINSLYFLVRISIEELGDFMEFYFSKELIEYLFFENINWYYLFYPQGERLQVRIRFLRVNENQKKHLLWITYQKLNRESLDLETRPYFPEIKKYGKKGYQISEELFHLESMLMVGQGPFGNGRIPSKVDLESLVLELWYRILVSVWTEDQIFLLLKERVKKIPFLEKQELKTYPNLGLQVYDKNGSYEAWIHSYFVKMLDQLKTVETNSEKWRNVGNHIHMQANRFFVLERKVMENWIYMQLYGRIGKERFKVVNTTSDS